MKTVGCEVYHGQGGKHVASPQKSNLIKRPPPALCLRCHTKERDATFSYREKLQLFPVQKTRSNKSELYEIPGYITFITVKQCAVSLL